MKIVVQNSQQLKSKKSLFISFDYDKEIVKILKTFPTKRYNPENREWEIPTSSFKMLLYRLGQYDMEFYGDLTSEMTKILDLEEQMRNQKTTNDEFQFKTKPFSYQLESFEYAKEHNCFILGDEQGLGKTKQAIDIAVYRKNWFTHCLIVCCANGLKWNWQKEIITHSNEKGHILGQRINKKGNLVIEGVKKRLEDLKKPHDEFFLITNIETIRDKDIAEQLGKMCQSGEIGMVIIDEIHKCKSSQTAQGKAIHKLNSYFKLALTGTPLMNSPIDLYQILKWIGVENHSLYQFKNFYCRMGGYCDTEIVGYKHLDKLSDTLNSVMLRRLKNDVLDLPPKIRTVEYVEMDKDQAKLYADIKAEILDNIDKVMLCPNPLVELIRLRQCTGYPGILSTKITKSSKLTRLYEIVEEQVSNGNKCIVFSNWTSITDECEKVLAKFNPAVITGVTKDRVAQENKFMKDDKCKVIIGTIAAMGTGLTLTAASTVIFMDECWNMANQEQAEDRAHRIGTKGTVNVISLVCKDTMDERINELINKKGEMSKMIVDGEIFSKANKSSLVNFLLS